MNYKGRYGEVSEGVNGVIAGAPRTIVEANAISKQGGSAAINDTRIVASDKAGEVSCNSRMSVNSAATAVKTLFACIMKEHGGKHKVAIVTDTKGSDKGVSYGEDAFGMEDSTIGTKFVSIVIAASAAARAVSEDICRSEGQCAFSECAEACTEACKLSGEDVKRIFHEHHLLAQPMSATPKGRQ